MNNKSDLIRNNYISLFLGYGISFAIIGLSYIFYSRLLTPGVFGLYSIALSISSFSIFVLDGGLKTAIIKHKTVLSRKNLQTLQAWLLLISFLLVMILLLLEQPLTWYFPAVREDYRFLAYFSAVYLISYPLIGIPTAVMERNLFYTKLAWIESISTICERALPVAFIIWGGVGVYSFLYGLIIGRVFRLAAVNCYCYVGFSRLSLNNIRNNFDLLKEGNWIQLASGVSLIRDNLHVILVGPFFGKEWVGYYSWGMQLCMVLSQAFVAVSARIALPRMAQQENFVLRWSICLEQIRYLTMLTSPFLFAGILVVPGIDSLLFHGKWAPVFPLLPFLFFRMLAGLVLTPIGALIPVQYGGMAFARCNIIWTIAEVISAVIFLKFVGSGGLAISYSLTSLLGVYIYLRSINGHAGLYYSEMIKVVLFRPSLLVSLSGSSLVLMTAFYSDAPIFSYLAANLYVISAIAAIIMLVSFLSEYDLRKNIRLILSL